jgi:hypothetical protein
MEVMARLAVHTIVIGASTIIIELEGQSRAA